MTAPLDLAAIRARVDAASIGPWTAADDGLVWAPRVGDPVSGSELPEDAAFIAHTRTDVPALLAEVERLIGELATAHAKLRQPCGFCHPCANWAAETWHQAGRNLPDVHKYGEMQDALARVTELHKLEMFAGIPACLACSPGMPPQVLVEWPCPTVRALSADAPDAPAQDAASGRTDPAEGEETHEAAPGAPRAAEGWRPKCCREFARTGITHTDACWAEDGTDA